MGKQDSPEGTVIFGSPEDAQDRTPVPDAEADLVAPLDETVPLYANHTPETPSEALEGLELVSAGFPAPVPPDAALPPRSPEPERESEPRVPGYSLRELERLVSEALAKRAAVGELSVTPSQVSWSTPLTTTHFALGPWMESWPRLSLAERKKHAKEIAHQLHSQGGAKPTKERPPRHIDLRIVGAVVFLLGLGGFLYFDTTGGAAGPSDPLPERLGTKEGATGASAEAMARTERVCAETRARIHQGGSVTVADAEGWLVEISLLTEEAQGSLAAHPLLSEFFEQPNQADGSRYRWPGAKLSSLDTSDTKVTVTDFRLADADSKDSIPGVTFSFGGALVDAYFSETNRGEYYRIAHALAEGLGATHGALYARCAHEKTHALGSWFLGGDAAQASSALVYFMGIYARPRHVASSYTHAVGSDQLDPLFAFRSIEKATQNLDRKALATLAGSQGGMATGKAGQAVIISFPFRDGNRASRASRNIARVTSLSQ